MTATIIIGILVVVGIIALISVLGSLYRKVGPNEALIVYGRGGTNVVVGGGTVVVPLFQNSQVFSLELLSFDLIPRADLYTQQGIPVKIEAVTQLKVENEEEKIKRAANQFLSSRDEDRQGMIRQLMEGHLRGIVGQLTVEQLVKEPEMVSARMRDTVAADLDKLGLEIVSFTIKDVNDDSGYIANLSRPMIAANQRLADIAEAEAQRDVAIRRAQTQREAAQAQAEAEQQIAVARSQAAATQAEAQRDLDLKTAEFRKSTAAAQAQAQVSGEIAAATAQRDLIDQQTAAELLRAQRQKDVQAAEAERKAAELVAEVQRPAEARANATKVQAQGEAAATQARAQAEADAARVRGQAQAAADAARIRETGNAEAESIRARGLAQAEALERRIAAQNQQEQVSLQSQMLEILPQMAEKIAGAYSKIGSVTYVSSGDGDGGVTSRIGRDIAGMIPVLGSVMESVTGRSMKSLFGNGHAADGRELQNGDRSEAIVATETEAPVPVLPVPPEDKPDDSAGSISPPQTAK